MLRRGEKVLKVQGGKAPFQTFGHHFVPVQGTFLRCNIYHSALGQDAECASGKTVFWCTGALPRVCSSARFDRCMCVPWLCVTRNLQWDRRLPLFLVVCDSFSGIRTRACGRGRQKKIERRKRRVRVGDRVWKAFSCLHGSLSSREGVLRQLSVPRI